MFTFVKKTAGAPAAAEPEVAVNKPHANAQQAKATTQAANFSFMKTGTSAKTMFDEEEHKAALAKEEAGKMMRLFMGVNEERQVTFLDGAMNSEGMIAMPYWHEHNIKFAGRWDQFVCTMEREGECPICGGGDSRPYMIGAMTVINHTPYTIQNGPNKGNIVQHRPMLYCPKRGTIKHLIKIANKQGASGLTGLTIDIGRTSDDEANVGNTFDIVNKAGSYEGAIEYMKKTYGLNNALDTKTGKRPFDLPNYEYEIGYHTAEELVKLGIGKASSGPGYNKTKSAASKVDKAALKDAM